MALVLVRLRLLIARRARGVGDGAQLYFASSWVLGGVGGLLAGMVTSTLVSGGGYADLLVVLGFCSIFLPWLIGPIVEPTLADGVVDPQRLEQFPLTGWQQVTGLLAGALVSPTAAFTFLFAAGGVVAFEESLGGRIASLVIALCFAVMCVAVSRAAQALLAGALHSRRGSDVAAIAASLLVLGIYLFAQQAGSASMAIGSQSVTGPLGTLLGWTPPGAAGLALVHARDGAWLDYGVRLSLVLATIGLALVAWVWALGRRVDGITAGHRKAGRRARVGALPLNPMILRPAPAGPGTAAAAQQLRYFFFRSPRALQTLIIPPVMGVVVAHTSFATYGLAAQAAAFAAMSVVAGTFNLFGYDGPGFGYLMLGGAPLRRVLVGKALAPMVYLVPMVLAFSLIETYTGAPRGGVLPAVLAGSAVVALGVGVGALSSVLNPSDQSRVGQRHGSFLKVFGWFMGFFAVVGVNGGLWWVLSMFTSELATGLCMLAVAITTGAIMLRWAGNRLERDPYRVAAKLDQADH